MIIMLIGGLALVIPWGGDYSLALVIPWGGALQGYGKPLATQALLHWGRCQEINFPHRPQCKSRLSAAFCSLAVRGGFEPPVG